MIFTAMTIIAGLVALFIGGEMLVRASVMIGLRFGLSNLVIGLTIVALGTSAPEMAVSIGAALAGATELAIANVVGSNLANIALVLALSALLKPIAIERMVLRRDMPIMLGSFALMAWVMMDGSIGRSNGVFLLTGLVAYIGYVVWQSSQSASREEELDDKKLPVLLTLSLLLAGIVLLVLGARWLVQGAITIATVLGVSQAVIGLTVVAVGTSLPEIAASIAALAKGHGAMAVGNVVGSNIWNTLGVLGVTAIISNLDQGNVGWDMLTMMAAVGLILWFFCRTRYQLSRYEGTILLLIYFGYQAWLFGGV